MLLGNILHIVLCKARTAARRLTVLVTVGALGAILVSGCGSNLSLSGSSPISGDEQTGEVELQISLKSLSEDVTRPLELVATMTQDGQLLTRRFPVNGEVITGRIEGIFVGPWDILLELQDDIGVVRYSSVESIMIRPDQPTVVQSTLTPAPGLISVTVDLSAFPNEQEVDKAKLVLSPGDLTDTAERAEGAMLMELAVSADPKTYDVRLELYKDTLHSYNMIYSSPWRQMTLKPGETVTFGWNPETGSLDIQVDINPAPPVPTNLMGVASDSAITLMWDDVSSLAPDLAGYGIYLRRGEFSVFENVAIVPAGETTFEVDISEETSGELLSFAVSSYDIAGNESARSIPWTHLVPGTL